MTLSDIPPLSFVLTLFIGQSHCKDLPFQLTAAHRTRRDLCSKQLIEVGFKEDLGSGSLLNGCDRWLDETWCILAREVKPVYCALVYRRPIHLRAHVGCMNGFNACSMRGFGRHGSTR